MRVFSTSLLFGLLACAAVPAALPRPAMADSLGIAAVVNDEVITSADAEGRLRFVLATTGLSDTPETRERLKPQILRQLVDETLQLQEGARLNYKVTEEEISQAIGNIEQNRGIPAGGLLMRLQQLDVPEETFRRQVHAQLIWGDIVSRRIRPQVRLSEEEIDRARMQAEQKTPSGTTADEVHISVLSLPVEKPDQEAQVKSLAEKLVIETSRGASFEAVARELSAGGASAPFWINPSQLDAAVAQALQPLAERQVSAPIRTQDGYTIVQLLNRRGARSLAPESDTELLLKDVLLRLKDDAAPQEVEMMLQIGRNVSKSPGTCTDAGIAGVHNVEDFDITAQFRRAREADLSDAVRQLVEGLPVGGVSQPFATPEGIRFFMLCERMEAPPALADRDQTQARLTQQKMLLEAQKYMRTLRRDAFIEIRF